MRATPFLVLMSVAAAGCASDTSTTSAPPVWETTTTYREVCFGHASNGVEDEQIPVLGVESSLPVAHETIDAFMDVEHPGWLNLTADWSVDGEGEVDLLVQRPGQPDEAVATSPFRQSILDPAPGRYNLTLRAHPVAYDVSYTVHVQYNFTALPVDGKCPGEL